jgi:hypothetical protein
VFYCQLIVILYQMQSGSSAVLTKVRCFPNSGPRSAACMENQILIMLYSNQRHTTTFYENWKIIISRIYKYLLFLLILCFWTLSTVLFYLKTPFCSYLKTMFRRLDSVTFFRWNLLSWAQSIELVPISGHIYQHQDGVYKPNTAQSICES